MNNLSTTFLIYFFNFVAQSLDINTPLTYVCLNRTSGEAYVGQTSKSVKKRHYLHRSALGHKNLGGFYSRAAQSGHTIERAILPLESEGEAIERFRREGWKMVNRKTPRQPVRPRSFPKITLAEALGLDGVPLRTHFPSLTAEQAKEVGRKARELTEIVLRIFNGTLEKNPSIPMEEINLNTRTAGKFDQSDLFRDLPLNQLPPPPLPPLADC